MRFRGHESFFIRKGWLAKGLRQVHNNEEVFISKKNNPMDQFGIGSNMVKSLRFWMQAAGLGKENEKGKRVQKLTSLGEIILKNDPYIEEYGTLSLIHYEIVKNQKFTTAWNFFFNHFTYREFTKDDFLQELKHYIKVYDDVISVAERSLEDDFNCIINTYISKKILNPEKDHPENIIDCPLGELELIEIVDRKNKIYRKNSPKLENISGNIMLAIILDQMVVQGNEREIKIVDLLSRDMSIGKLFNLDPAGLMQILERLQDSGLIRVIRTAGLDVVRINEDISFEKCIDDYYKQHY